MYLLALAELESPAHPDLLTTQRQPQFSGEIVGVMKLLYFSFPAGPGYVVARKALGSSAAWQSKPVLPVDGHQGETVPWLQRRRGISLTR